MKIKSRDFFRLFSDVEKQFILDYQQKYGEGNSGELPAKQIFGLSGYDASRDTIKQSLLRHEAVADWLRQRGVDGNKLKSRYLYDKRNRVRETRDQEVKLNAPYDRIFFLYLGHQDYESFKASIEQDVTYYTGYYYSYLKHQINEYRLKIDYTQSPDYPGVPHQKFTAEEEGYHDNLSEPIYEGYGYVQKGKLQLVLFRGTDAAEEDRLRILFESGDNPSENTAMRGAVLAVSSYTGRPISSAETVVVKENGNTIYPEDRLRIKRYLLLHRNNFRVNAKTLNLQIMEAKGISVDILRHFVGVWRVFRYDGEFQSVSRSFLIVTADYRITCITDAYAQNNMNEQVCLPNVTTDRELGTPSITLDCYPKEGAKRISTLAFKVPTSKDTHVEGVMLLLGQEGDPPMMRAAILEKASALNKEIEAMDVDPFRSPVTIRDVLMEYEEPGISSNVAQQLRSLERLAPDPGRPNEGEA